MEQVHQCKTGKNALHKDQPMEGPLSCYQAKPSSPDQQHESVTKQELEHICPTKVGHQFIQAAHMSFLQPSHFSLFSKANMFIECLFPRLAGTSKYPPSMIKWHNDSANTTLFTIGHLNPPIASFSAKLANLANFQLDIHSNGGGED